MNMLYAWRLNMLEVITPYMDTILVAIASGVLSIVAYAKIAVKNITPEEAEHIALEVVTAMGDGVLSPEEKQNIIKDAIVAMRSK
jgi:hypothetical protein